jgi:hypothetical protein
MDQILASDKLPGRSLIRLSHLVAPWKAKAIGSQETGVNFPSANCPWIDSAGLGLQPLEANAKNP